ncbi:MAG: hypothetical protein C3F06_11495 [Candidatus Methanoperedenaceae archaeon]|nr:MAG: hypothetical protein C3F06_11495 [Candidatus Methanoperedenaceae archaeon]
MKVMIVDDNKFDRMMLSKMLVYNKYDVVEAGNGIEALKLISTENPDIVVSDIMMPEMDGFSLLREIRKSKSAKELPFVFYSASYVSEKDKELADSLGVSRFIIKPVEPRELIMEITQILQDFSSGKLEIIEPTLKDEEYLEKYSRRIFKKLQEKVIELEQEIDERKRIEEELRNSEAKFRATFEEAPIGMARLNIEGRILETNHILQQMLGISGEELKGKVFTEFTHPDDVEIDTDQFRELISGKKNHYMIKKRYIRKKGKVFWARVTVSLVRDANGHPQFSISMVEDITERKEAEDKLQMSEEKYRTLIENIQDGVFVIQDGKIQYINEFFPGIAGYEVEDVIGKDFREFVAPEDRERITDYYFRREAGEKVPRENEFNIMHKDGKRRITINMNIGFINYRGKIASMGTLKDITESRKARELIRRSKEFAETVLNSINDSISIINVMDFSIIDSNKAFLEQNGLSKEDVIGKKCYEITHNKYTACSQDECPLQETLRTGKPSIAEHIHPGRNGIIHYVEVSAHPILNEDGKIGSVVHLARDITERKRAQEDLEIKAQLLDSASDFIYVHDFNGNFIYMNEAAYRLHGYTKDEMMMKNLRDIMAPEYRKLMDQRIKDLLQKREYVFESVDLVKSNKRIEVEVHSRVIEYGGQKVILSVSRDITLRKQAEKMAKENARAELYGFIVSALPVFASGVPSQVRDFLIKNFSERFEKNVKPRFNEEMKQKSLNSDQLLEFYMIWVSTLFLNFGIENIKKTEGKKRVLEFTNCPWIHEARGNPIFCFICRSLAKRSFTWTALNGIVEQKSSIASGSKICRFEILVHKDKLQEA